jgi:hypothetical protein
MSWLATDFFMVYFKPYLILNIYMMHSSTSLSRKRNIY